ncbi:MAG: sterol desaturase family protein [Candidatus Yanofskybacteria bacterium]|nr:sterol desaturase family protein [Candidatus Yanofskybacteria bacterium]
MSLHLPVFKSVGAAVFAFILVLLAHSWFGDVNLFFWSWVGVFVSVAGMIYTQLFEYLWHKVFMHVGVKFFETVKKSHLKHHVIFDGDNFQSRKPEDLDWVTTKWYVFPPLLFVHYSIFCLFWPKYGPVFFGGVVLHFVIYEICHWCSHVKDNGLDSLLVRIPFLGPARLKQIEHHRMHHAEPVINFNFTPPYAGDRFFKTLVKS